MRDVHLNHEDLLLSNSIFMT